MPPAELLQPIAVGASNDLQVGQKVFAIGNPFGLDYTLTTGVISALDRHIKAEESTRGFETERTITGVIQTDAAINPGNSGGPLLDSSGRLIGVNTAIYSPSGAYAGVGFAIPVDTVNRIVPQLIRHGKIARPDIGILPAGDRILGDHDVKGVLIQSVIRNSAADRAGLRPTKITEVRRGYRRAYYIQYGDIIVGADDEEINKLDDWYTFLESHKPGDVIKLTVERGFQTGSASQLTVDIPLGQPRIE